MIVNKNHYRGIFPRKGKKQIRLRDCLGKEYWILLEGAVELAEVMGASAHHLPLEVLEPDPRLEVWRGDTGAMRVSVPKGFWATVIKEHSVEECDGPKTYYTQLIPGDQVRLKKFGDIHQAGSWWLRRPE